MRDIPEHDAPKAPQSPDVCARCAGVSRTCCALVPGQEEFCFPLSAPERTAMEAAGAKAGHFARQKNTPAFVENLCRLFPGQEEALRQRFPAGQGHDRLALSAEGVCLLLGDKGCALPRAARPYYCRLFPFWIRAGRQLFFEFRDCQAQREGAGGAGLLRRLGMTEAQVRELFAGLCRAWNLSGRS